MDAERALAIYKIIITDLGCKSSTEYDIFNKKRGLPYPNRSEFLKNYKITFSEVKKELNIPVSNFKYLNLTEEQIIKLTLLFLEETDYTLSMVNFDAWYGRDISQYISKKFKSWNIFKKEIYHSCRVNLKNRIKISYRKEK